MTSQSLPPHVSSKTDTAESQWEEVTYKWKDLGTLKQIIISHTKANPRNHFRQQIYKEAYLKEIHETFSTNFPVFLRHLKKYDPIPELQPLLSRILKEQLKSWNDSTQQASKQHESRNDSDCKMTGDPRKVLLQCLQSIAWIVERSPAPPHDPDDSDSSCSHCTESVDSLVSFLEEFEPHSDGYDFVRQEVAARILCTLSERGFLCPKVQRAAFARLSKALNVMEKHPAFYYGILVAVSSMVHKQIPGQSLTDNDKNIFAWCQTLPVHLLDRLLRNCPDKHHLMRVWDMLSLALEQYAFLNPGQGLEDGVIGRKWMSHYVPVGPSSIPCEFSWISRQSQVPNPMVYSLAQFLTRKKGERSLVLPEVQKCTLVSDSDAEEEDGVNVCHFQLPPFPPPTSSSLSVQFQ